MGFQGPINRDETNTPRTHTIPKTPKGMSWGVKTTCLEAPGVSLGGSGVSIGGVGSLRDVYIWSN